MVFFYTFHIIILMTTFIEKLNWDLSVTTFYSQQRCTDWWISFEFNFKLF